MSKRRSKTPRKPRSTTRMLTVHLPDSKDKDVPRSMTFRMKNAVRAKSVYVRDLAGSVTPITRAGSYPCPAWEYVAGLRKEEPVVSRAVAIKPAPKPLTLLQRFVLWLKTQFKSFPST